MSIVETTQVVTPDDLLKMPDGDRYELVDGQLVERDMGSWSSHVGGELFFRIKVHNNLHRLGWVLPADCGYQCFPDAPNQLRRPDASFIRRGRLSGEKPPDGHTRIAPDLVVEVISPNDLDYETDQKVEEYLHAGVRLVWVVNPDTHTVLIYRADGSIVGRRAQDELDGEDVLPGFRCRIADLFATPAEPSA